jgi:hypothetical protein
LEGVIHATDVEMLKQCMEQMDMLEKQQARRLTHLEALARQKKSPKCFIIQRKVIPLPIDYYQ